MPALLVLRAQALDNTSHDDIELNGKSLTPEEVDLRETATSIIADVVRDRKRIFDRDGVRMTVRQPHFVIDKARFVMEVRSVEKDRVGRIAAIVCCATMGDTPDDAAFTASAVREFAGRIGRSIRPDVDALIRSAFDVAKKKVRKQRTASLGLGVALAILGIVCAAFFHR